MGKVVIGPKDLLHCSLQMDQEQALLKRLGELGAPVVKVEFRFASKGGIAWKKPVMQKDGSAVYEWGPKPVPQGKPPVATRLWRPGDRA